MVQAAQPGGAQEEFVSLNPDDAETGGTPPPDGNYLWSNVKFELFDFPQRKEGPLPVGQRATTMVADLTDDKGKVWNQRWNCGNEVDFVPSPDGARLKPVGRRRGLSDNSAGYAVLKGAVDAGFQQPIAQDVRVLDGMYAFCTLLSRTFNITGVGERTTQYLVPTQLLDASTRNVAGASVPGQVQVQAPAPGAPVPATVVAPVPVAAAPVVAPIAAPVAVVAETPAQASAKEYLGNLVKAGQLPATIPALTTKAFTDYAAPELAAVRNDVVAALNDGGWLASTGLVTVSGTNLAQA